MQRGASAGGPFVTPPGGGHLIARGDPVVTEATILAGKAGRIAPDRFWLLDPSPGGGPGLDHYLVTEQWCRGSVNVPAGEATVSTVTLPGAPRLVTFDPVANEERLLESPVRPKYEGQWLVIDLALAWPDQHHARSGMHVLATRDGWRGSFFSASRDAGADRTRDTRGPGWCRVRVPHRPGAGDVTLVIHAPDGPVRRVLQVADPAGAAPGATGSAGALEASVAKVRRDTDAAIARLETELARLEASIAASAPPPDWPAVHGQYLDRAARIDLAAELERHRTLTVPLVELDLELHRAQAAGDWKGQLAVAKRRFRLLRQGLTFESKRRIEADALFAWVAAHARSPRDLQHLDEWKRARFAALDTGATRARSEIDALIFRLADGEVAALAGDEWALRVIGHQVVGRYELQAGMATELTRLADRLAILTGDRLEAASLWRTAADLPSRGPGPRPTEGPLPAWWPDERAPGAVPAAPFPGPDAREEMLVRWLTPPASEPR
jgi:hypothetical protein